MGRLLLLAQRSEAGGERAGGLAREVVDVNCVLADLRPMLRRLVGDNIDLRVAGAPAPATARISTSDLQHVIVNLVANARDVILPHGCIWIAARSFIADDTVTAAHPDVPPGKYVAMDVAYSGHRLSDDMRIASSILRRHRAHLVVETRPERGGRVTVLLRPADAGNS